MLRFLIGLLLKELRTKFSHTDSESNDLLQAEETIRKISERKEDEVIAAGERIIREREKLK